jgi:Holliday junction resolvase RusA-like endonuclease
MRVTFKAEGKPMGKGRPRVVQRNGKTRAYTPEKTASYEQYIKLCFMTAEGGNCFRENCYESPLKLSVKAYYEIPKGFSKKKREAALNPLASPEIRPGVRPDIDNIVKAVLDALNKLAFRDDSRVVELQAEKYYADKPYIEVTLENLD